MLEERTCVWAGRVVHLLTSNFLAAPAQVARSNTTTTRPDAIKLFFKLPRGHRCHRCYSSNHQGLLGQRRGVQVLRLTAVEDLEILRPGPSVGSGSGPGPGPIRIRSEAPRLHYL